MNSIVLQKFPLFIEVSFFRRNVHAPDRNPQGTGWYDYSDSRQVERLFREYTCNGRAGNLSQRFISSGHFTYRVDFVQMMQTNVTHHNRKSRRIRRVDFAGGTFNGTSRTSSYASNAG